MAMKEQSMNDKDIVDLYLARSERAIAATSEKYGRMLNSIAYNVLGSVSDCEECVNDTYLAAWNKIPPQIPNNFAAFLGRIARNTALNKYAYLSAAKRSAEFEVAMSELGEMLSDKSDPEKRYEATELGGYISEYLHSQPYQKRSVFVRRYWYCDPVKEISKKFGYSESKVKSMLMRMRKELKNYLERKGIEL